MDYLAIDPRFNNLSLADLLFARDQFHVHLMHKPNVVGTAVGRYLIRKTDPRPAPKPEDAPAPSRRRRVQKPARTLENSEVRDYSWPCVLVFVSRWVSEREFGAADGLAASAIVPKTIFLADGRSVPICVVLTPTVENAPPPVDIRDLTFPQLHISGGYPVLVDDVQGVPRQASLGCLVSDGHRIYALTNRHVTGEPGSPLSTIVGKQKVVIGHSSRKQLGKMPFERVYEGWTSRHVFVNLDVGLIDITDLKQWSPAVYGLGQLGPLANLTVHNMTLQLIGCPVQAYGSASGRLNGVISALFYRYKSVGGFDYVADFLIGSGDDKPLQTRPGDSGTVWAMEPDTANKGLLPFAVQWGGTVFSGDTASLPFALATNLSTVCRELDVDLYRSATLAKFEYWGAVGHYTVAAYSCQLMEDANLGAFMMQHRDSISYDPDAIDRSVNRVKPPDFVPLADVPDKVWKVMYNEERAPYGRKGLENPNHYSDIDLSYLGQQSLDAQTPNAAALLPDTWIDYYRAIHWNSVSQRGLLPFRVWQIYKAMVEYVQQGQIAEYLTAAGVLAHYIADACQPLHGSYLDDGDPFRRPDGTPVTTILGHGKGWGAGVHTAYETTMIEAHITDLMQNLPQLIGASHQMSLVNGGQEAGYATIELIRRCQAIIPPAQIVDTYGNLKDGDDSSTELWNQFGQGTLQVMADGCRTLAMLWESAWVEGNGDPALLTPVDASTIQGIYEDRNFLPSVALGQIAQYL